MSTRRDKYAPSRDYSPPLRYPPIQTAHSRDAASQYHIEVCRSGDVCDPVVLLESANLLPCDMVTIYVLRRDYSQRSLWPCRSIMTTENRGPGRAELNAFEVQLTKPTSVILVTSTIGSFSLHSGLRLVALVQLLEFRYIEKQEVVVFTSAHLRNIDRSISRMGAIGLKALRVEPTQAINRASYLSDSDTWGEILLSVREQQVFKPSKLSKVF